MLWQILWLRNTHITAGGEGLQDPFIMTKLLNILKQELDPLKTATPFPIAPLEMSPGKRSAEQDTGCHPQANPSQRLASLINV